MEALKQRIVSYAARLRKYNARLQRFKQNSLFRSNERAFYSGLLKRNDVVPPAPDISQLKSFWRNIFEKHSLANLNCLWLNDLQSHVNSSRSFVADSPGFTKLCFVDCLRKLRNWAAPGPDGIQGFWIKRFPALHERLLQCYNDMLNDSSTIPSWFTKGRTILLPKSQDTTLPKNFRPITCLNVVYKAMDQLSNSGTHVSLCC